MTPEQIMSRLDAKIDEYMFRDSEEHTIQTTFNSLCVEKSGVKYLDEAAFVSHFIRCFPSHVDSVTKAGPVLYRSAIYLAQFPLPSDEPVPLTLRALRRALALLLPDRSNGWAVGGSVGDHLVGRERGEDDVKRLLFQSLATVQPASADSLSSDCDEREIRPRPKDSTLSPFSFTAPNKDADGDEMYHDVLDVLAATQPSLGVQYILTPRDAFRPTASKIWHARRLIRDYRIPGQNFKALVELMLSMHLSDSSKNGTESTNDQSESDAAECVVRAFIEREGYDIAWPTFYTTLLTATVSVVTI